MSKGLTAVLIAGFFSMLTAYAIRFSYGILLPEMLPALDISKAEAGVIYASYFMAYLICSPVLGFLVDRYDLRAILTLSMGILGTGALLISLASSLLTACVFFSVAGAGHSASWVTVVVLFQRWFSEKRKGAAIAFADTGSSIGIFLVGVGLPFIVRAAGWRSGWITLGIVAFLVSLMSFMMVKSSPERGDVRQKKLSETAPGNLLTPSYLSLFRKPNLWIIGSSYLFASFSVWVVSAFITIYANQGLGMPYRTSTRFISIIALTSILGKLSLGALSDVLGRIRVMMLCLGLTSLGSFGIALSGGESMLALSSGIMGFGYGAIWTLYAACASDFFPKESSGSVVGIWTMFLGIGAIIGPILGGWSIDASGGYSWVFFLPFAGSLVSLFLLVPVKKPSGVIQPVSKV